MNRPFKLGAKVRLKKERTGEVVGYTGAGKDNKRPITVVVRMDNGDICQFYPEGFLEEVKENESH